MANASDIDKSSKKTIGSETSPSRVLKYVIAAEAVRNLIMPIRSDRWV